MPIIMLRGFEKVHVQLRCTSALVTVDCHLTNPSPLKLNYGVLDENEVDLWAYTSLPRPRF